MLKRCINYPVFAIVTTLLAIFASILLSLNLQIKYISSDGFGYYSFLPAVFINHDISFKSIVDTEAVKKGETLPIVETCSATQPLCNEFAGFKPLTNGSWYDKYPVGVALLESPFFFGADLFVKLTGGIRDGYSTPYQVSIAIAGIVYFQLGLFFAYKVLKNRFSKNLTLLLLVFLIAATNIFHYAVYEPSMSHIYSFALITAAIFLLDKYLKKPSAKILVFVGIVLSLIILIRNANALFVIIPLFVIIKNSPAKSRIKIFLKICLIWGAILLSAFIPQMLYWKTALGQFIAYSYGSESFIYLLHPQIGNVLFGLESNGLFFWHPLLILIIPGAYFWIKSSDKISRISIILLLILLYFFSSWWAYSFGYAFGYRAYTDYYILFLIPIGYLFQRLARVRRKPLVIIFVVIVILFCILNLIQMRNYWGGIVASYNLTVENYWRNFANPHLELLWQKIGVLFHKGS